MDNRLQLYPKAYFNWARLKWEHTPSFSVPPWQVEDYRELTIETLLERLASLGLVLTGESFLLVAENYQSPEELTRYLWPKKENEFQIYLILFELWRRLLPEKNSLSIFCDELDNRMRLYLKDPTHDHGLSNSLQRLQEIVEESTELGDSPRAIFATLSRHVAHDLEGFLFDYISDQIDSRNDVEAAELLKNFYPCVSDAMSFNFLRSRLLVLIDPHEGNLAFVALLNQLEQAPDLDLLLEIAAFLIHHGDPSLFQKAAGLAVDHLKTEEDLQELLAIVADYCHFVEKEKEEEEIQAVFAKRLSNEGAAPVKITDLDIVFLRKLLNDTEWSKI